MSHILVSFPKAESTIFDVLLSINLYIFKCYQYKSAEITTISFLVEFASDQLREKNIKRIFDVCGGRKKTISVKMFVGQIVELDN